MDFMFEDEVDEVGSDVEAYCPKCKADTTHVVISKYEDEIRRVQCNPCGDVHSYRKPRGEVEEDVPEPIAAKKRAMMKKATWDEFFAKHGDKQGKPYEFRENYAENVVVTHPKFGRGFVSEILSDSKVEITFKDGRRVLVHNRRDMPGLPLAAEGDGIPSTGAKAKAAKKAAAAAAAAAGVTPGVVPAIAAPVAGAGKAEAKSPEGKSADKSAEAKSPEGKSPEGKSDDRSDRGGPKAVTHAAKKPPEKAPHPEKSHDKPSEKATPATSARAPVKAAAGGAKGGRPAAKPAASAVKKSSSRKPAKAIAATAAKKKKKK